MMRLSAVLLSASIALFSLGACSSSPESFSTTDPTTKAPATKNKTTKPNKQKLETVYGFEVRPDELKFLVKSNNCTSANHFDLSIEPESQSGIYSIALMRNKVDRCRAMPRIVAISMPLKAPLNHGARLNLKNPFKVNSHLNRQPTVDR